MGAILAGRYINEAPKPPIKPIVNMSIGMLGLIGERASPIARTILPEIQTGLNPNLSINPPVIGPNMVITPKKSEPTQETVDTLES